MKEQEATSKKPPMIPTNMEPWELIGPSFLAIFTEHYKAVHGSTPDQFEKNLKGFSADNRKTIGDIYEKLRKHGYYPAGLEKNGQIFFTFITERRPDKNEWLKLDRPPYPSRKEVVELRKQCRQKFDRFIDSGIIKVDELDLATEASL